MQRVSFLIVKKSCVVVLGCQEVGLSEGTRYPIMYKIGKWNKLYVLHLPNPVVFAYVYQNVLRIIYFSLVKLFNNHSELSVCSFKRKDAQMIN